MDLLAQPSLRRKAEATLRARQKLWDDAVALAEKARAAFAQAPDPGPKPTLDDVAAEIERQRLFRIIEDLVQWENTTNETVLNAARDEIWQSWRRACADNADHPRAKELFDRHKLPALASRKVSQPVLTSPIIRAGLGISGTWPMRSELATRNVGRGTNALASSIIIVCRPRDASASVVTRREFVASLRKELPVALRRLQAGNIAPVDLAQAAIGPGMAVYTQYARVIDAEGRAMQVSDALSLINDVLDETLAEQESDFDPDTRWALTWFEQQGFSEGEFGTAEQLSKSKNTSVDGMVSAGIVHSKRGKVRLLRPEELPTSWNPATDPRLTAWELVHHLLRVLENGGEPAAAAVMAQLGTKAEVARELCYRLYTICERQKHAEDALRYNALVDSWPEIVRLAGEPPLPEV